MNNIKKREDSMVEKKEQNIEKFLNKKIKVIYNSLSTEVCRDEGLLIDIDDNFISLKLFDGRTKGISLNKIIRWEEL